MDEKDNIIENLMVALYEEIITSDEYNISKKSIEIFENVQNLGYGKHLQLPEELML